MSYPAQFTPFELMKETCRLYGECARNASLRILTAWPVLVGSLAAFLVLQVAAALLGDFGMAGGMLIGLAEAALLSLYYLWLQEAMTSRKLKLKDLLQFDVSLFGAVISVAFILWIARWLLGSLVVGTHSGWIQLIFSLVVVLALNALPEVIYIGRYESMYAVQYAARFITQNWIEWFLPFAVLLLPWMALGLPVLAVALSSSHPLLPVSAVFMAPQLVFPAHGLLMSLAGLVLANWFMLFRGFLYKSLESGSRRQRAFLSRQR